MLLKSAKFLLILVSAAWWMLCGIGSAIAQQSHWGRGYLPNVPVIDQDGRTLKFYDDVIKDKIVVVSFIYTVCKDICPLLTARLSLLQEQLGDQVGRDFFFVSISIDPETDTPDRLKQYANAFRLGPGWTFLTGTKADIDLIRYKLGERSRTLAEHRKEILLGNDRTGEWARDSAFSDLVVLANNVRDMDPAWLHGNREPDTITEANVTTATNQPGQTLFLKTCGSCHTVGKGNRVGPDLLGLLERRDRPWVTRYMMAPEVLRAQQDPTAMELAQRYRAVRMPNLGLSEDDVADLLHFVESQSKTVAVSTKAP